MKIEDTKKKRKKYIRNIILLIFLVWLTFHVLFKDQNMDELFNILINVRFIFDEKYSKKKTTLNFNKDNH